MASNRILTNALIFRWDEMARQLLVIDPNSAEPDGTIAKIGYATLDNMSWPAASQFIGEFVTLLIPTLRARYESEFADANEPTDRSDA